MINKSDFINSDNKLMEDKMIDFMVTNQMLPYEGALEDLLEATSYIDLPYKEFVYDYFPTGRCVQACEFCYGAKTPSRIEKRIINGNEINVNMYLPSKETIAITGSSNLRPELTFHQALRILTLMRLGGATYINIGGGEPLLRQETPAYIKYIKTVLGTSVYISTEGSLLLQRYNEFKEYIDVIGMSLDGASIDMNVKMSRRSFTFPNVQRILEYFQSNEPSHKVRIGTVVSNINKDDIINIADWLYGTQNQYKPDVWRLYQFESIGRGLDNASKFKIADQDFERIVKQIINKYGQYEIKPRSNEQHLNAYYFITPDGMIQNVDENYHVSIADMTTINLKQLKTVINQHQEIVNKANQNRDWFEKK